METEYEIFGILRGTFWWPMGEEWEKPVSYRFRRGDVDSYPVSAPVHSTLREALDRTTNDGDSSSGCTIDSGLLIVTHRKANSKRVRYFDLESFPSIKDYLA